MRGRLAFVVASLVAGCGFDIDYSSTSGTDGGGGADDGGGGATGDGSLGCYGTGLVVVCSLTPPPPSFEVTVPVTIDTNVTGNCTAVSGTNVNGTCVVIAERIEIDANVRGIGLRPLVFVATQTMSISAAIDVASHDGSTGAGFTTAVCQSSAGPGGLGGGAGGSFVGQGGAGGNSDGGTAGPTTIPTSLRGGCKGQKGAGTFDIAGDGANGGGAFYAIAGTSIEIDGTINASGGGGHGGGFGVTNGGGGGGGGSGGMIGLDAPMVSIGGHVFANGGGGGGGSSGTSNAGKGDDPVNAVTMPEGGTNAGGAGRGGRGSVGTLLEGGPGDERTILGNGGGGGGGGAGYIKIYGTQSITGQVSPPPS